MEKEYSVHLGVPLLLRLLEFAREDSKSDLDLHFLTENVIKLSGDRPLTMKDYDEIVRED